MACYSILILKFIGKQENEKQQKKISVEAILVSIF